MYNQIASNKRKSFLLIFFFVAFIIFLGWLFGQLLDLGYSGLFFAILLSIGMSLMGYYAGDKIALATAGAKPIAKDDNPYLYRIIENLCITTGLPLPKIYLIPDPAINAFATGRDPKHASMAVTTGTLEKLENEELEGVIAHELSHIKNLDVRLMMLVAVLVGTIALLANFFLRAQLFGGRRDRDREGGNLGALLLLIGLVFAILSPLIAQLVQLAVSRRREFLADASGSLLTRYPEGLARALEKIGKDHKPLRSANPATAHLYFTNPFGQTGKFLTKLFSTHPPLEERIRTLRSMA